MTAATEQEGKHRVDDLCAPSHHDIWQAAALLVGVYGSQAVDYATERETKLRQEKDFAGTKTWGRIVDQIVSLLHAAPTSPLH